MIKKYKSFGNYPKAIHKGIVPMFRRSASIDFENFSGTLLPYGLGKSYGDSCLNPNNYLIDCSYLSKMIAFNEETGILTAESGVTLKDIIDLCLPKGFFLAVTPGTKLITLGGAIANDVHGKNHHKSGTFSSHLISFELLRSDGNLYHCSRNDNIDLFKATIGGLGLTGIITSAEIQMERVNGPIINAEFIKFNSFEEFMEINYDSNQTYDFTVAWVNTTNFGHGIYTRGNFAPKERQVQYIPSENNMISLPFYCEIINPLSVGIFNLMYQGKQLNKFSSKDINFENFFYPLDSIGNWNRAYGKNGFIQYQLVIPFDNGLKNLKEIFLIISKSGLSSFLTVLKTFGDYQSPGILSFPASGITLAIDFKMIGEKLLAVLNEIDKIVIKSGGSLYPAKDSRMSSNNFQIFYPNVSEFKKFIDPKFSSGFWRRVNRP